MSAFGDSFLSSFVFRLESINDGQSINFKLVKSPGMQIILASFPDIIFNGYKNLD